MGIRPWYAYGEGEYVIGKHDKKSNQTSSDIRFVTKDDLLYAFVMDWPQKGKQIIIIKLGIMHLL
ncbi:MAG: hypothetical protein WBM98_01455 [Maribacter sp.]|uniref:hypothetical protein n=1 Tax=Maribacter sp. TaxID=1897614 RepID=UPI003C779176